MELTQRELEIIRTIHLVRDEHHACTAAEVAARLGISRAYMSDVMHAMRERDLVTWSEHVVGSVRALRKIDGSPLDDAETPSLRCSQCDWPNEAAIIAHTKAKHNVKTVTTKRRDAAPATSRR